MGFKEWRQRQLDRADRMIAWSDRVGADLEEKRAREATVREANQAERETKQEAAQTDALAEWMNRRAAQLCEDHDDLAARANAVGMELPAPERRLGRERGSTGAFADGAGSEHGRIDSYESWRDRIVIEELMATKLARGEELTRSDRLSLKTARQASK
jgi:hypothetical protein